MELSSALISSGQVDTMLEAKEVIKEMKERFNDGEDPEEILREYGLEPDYIFDILM
jgi:uncharacterized protein (DUF433 family)